MKKKFLGHNSPSLMLKKWVLVLPLILVSGCQSLRPTTSNDDVEALGETVRNLQQEQMVLKKELAELRQLLNKEGKTLEPNNQPQKPPEQPPLPMAMDISNTPALGNNNAPVILIEFTDYQCPFCRRYFETVMQQLIKTYVGSGKVRYLVKEFPLQKLHPLAPRAAMAAQCAGGQGNYWPMHDILFRSQTPLQPDDLKGFSDSLGMDTEKFLDCLNEGLYAPQIMADFKLGVTAGVRGTPFFFLGLSDKDSQGKIVVSNYLYGVQPFDVFQQVIESLLTQHINHPE